MTQVKNLTTNQANGVMAVRNILGNLQVFVNPEQFIKDDITITQLFESLYLTDEELFVDITEYVEEYINHN